MKQINGVSSADQPISYRWALERVLIPIVMTGGTIWLTYINVQVADIKASIAELDRQVTTNTTNNQNSSESLKRIESKLDRLIEAR